MWHGCDIQCMWINSLHNSISPDDYRLSCTGYDSAAVCGSWNRDQPWRATRALNDGYNELIRAHRSSYAYLMDLQNILNDVWNTNYFYTDNTHFQNAGYSQWAQAAANALNSSGSDRFGMPIGGRYITAGSGTSNTRLEENALYSLTTGSGNGGGGYGALCCLTTGNYNWAWGDNTLTGLTSGSFNVAIGHGSGANIVTGGNNTSVLCSPTGDFSGTTCLGADASPGSSYSTSLGYNSSTTAQCTAVGVAAACTANGSAEIATTANSTKPAANTLGFQNVPVIDSNGYLYANTSTPGSSSATCIKGQIWADATYVYACTATNTIKRAALTSF